MGIRQAGFWLLIALILIRCGHNRYELYQRLPEQDKELFDRSRQFMTDRQQEAFLLLTNSEARAELIEKLHIQDRLLKFPVYVRDAILAQEVVPGMGAEAVLLSWGKPNEIDRRDVDGVPAECWYYSRGDANGNVVEKRVYFLRDIVTEVAP